MPRYVFKAYGSGGGLETGEIDADNERLALELIAQRGLFALEIGVGATARAAGAPWWRREFSSSRTLGLAAQALLARELSTLLKAGIVVDEALAIIALQPRISAAMRSLVGAVQADVRSGSSLSSALAARGNVPEPFWMLVRAGEASGRLGDVLTELSGSLEETVRRRKQLATATVYPAVLLVASVLTIVLIATVMVPAILPLFRDAGAEPPLLLSALAGMEQILLNHWPVVLIGMGLIVAAARIAARTERISYSIDKAMLHAPLLKDFVQRGETARFARTLALLLQNGVPMLDALRITSTVLQNRVFKAAVLQVQSDVNSGGSLIAPLSASALFPPLALRLIAVGEQSAQLPVMLARVAQIYEHDLRQQIERVVAVSTPALTVLIGGVVGFIMLSVVSAMLSLNEVALR